MSDIINTSLYTTTIFIMLMKSKKQINREHYLKNKSDINAKRKAKREAKKAELEALKIAVNQNTQSAITSQSQPTQPELTIDHVTQPDITQPTQPQIQQPNELNISISGLKIRMPDYREFLNASNEKYNIRFGEDKLIKRWIRQTRSKAVLVEGGSGIGKTAFAKYYATLHKDPCIFFSCHSTIDKDELCGSMQLENNSSVYILGAIFQAIEISKQSPTKRAFLILDELNTLTPEAQKNLNEKLNFHEGVYNETLGMKFKLDSDCEILVYATANPSSYAGTFELNRELKSRFKIFQWPDFTDSQLKQIINDQYKTIADTTIENILQLRAKIKSAEKEGKLNEGLDPREILRFCETFEDMKTNEKATNEEALKTACREDLFGKYAITDDEDQIRLITELIESDLGVNLKDD